MSANPQSLVEGTAFPMEERERLQLRGLLPPRTVTMEIQVGRLVDDLIYGRDYVEPEEVRVNAFLSNAPKRA